MFLSFYLQSLFSVSVTKFDLKSAVRHIHKCSFHSTIVGVNILLGDIRATYVVSIPIVCYEFILLYSQ